MALGRTLAEDMDRVKAEVAGAAAAKEERPILTEINETNPCYSSDVWETDTRVYYPKLGEALQNLTAWMGEFVDDFDVDAYLDEHGDQINEILARYGIKHIGSGIFHCDYYREEPLPDEEELIEALEEIDYVSIAKRHEKPGPAARLGDEAEACRTASQALSGREWDAGPAREQGR